MTRLLGLSILSAAAVATVPGALSPARVAAQAALLAPQVQNGPVEHRPVTDLARDLTALGSGATPVWIGWTVPMANGPRDLCNWYSNPSMTVRGFFAEAGQPAGPDRPQIAPATGPVPLEAGHGLVVLARMSDGTLDQVRTLSDDCPIDAGGRAVYWLDGVTAAQSLAWLDRQTGVEATTAAARVETDRLRSIASAALTAVALHAAPDADRILERIATSDAADNLRRQAGSRMAAYRGAAGFEALRRLIAAEADEATRRSFVSALGQTRELGAADVLLELARTDPAPRVRGEAAYHYIRFAGEAGADAIVTLIERDAELSVKRRAISGLAALPGDAGIPHLIELARRSQDLTVKKEAVSAITRSDDPRARAFLAEIIRS